MSLGFIYNAQNVDQTYGSLPPPAAGFDFFQGPRVPSTGATATFRGRTLDGFRNLPMTAFFYFIKSDLTLADPPDETTHWSVRAMAEAAGIGAVSVQRIWQATGLTPRDIEDVFFGNAVRLIEGLA